MIDAHNHLQRLCGLESWPRILAEVLEADIDRMLVNGTSESDWSEVARVAETYDWVTPSFGIHPWNSAGRSAAWIETLRNYLLRFPDAGVGEVGLDRSMEEPDLEDQERLFVEQIALAAELNRPLTVHCVRAWGAVLETLKKVELPRFLIHAYGGPGEMVREFANLGAYFSFNGTFLAQGKEKKLGVFRSVPPDRLLLETDAPDLLLPEALDSFLLRNAEGTRLHHPACLRVALGELARVLNVDVEVLEERLDRNFEAFMGKRD